MRWIRLGCFEDPYEMQIFLSRWHILLLSTINTSAGTHLTDRSSTTQKYHRTQGSLRMIGPSMLEGISKNDCLIPPSEGQPHPQRHLFLYITHGVSPIHSKVNTALHHHSMHNKCGRGEGVFWSDTLISFLNLSSWPFISVKEDWVWMCTDKT